MKIAVSACLLGYNCKYNGGNNYNQRIIELEGKYELVPICPECFGGLTTPRFPSEIINKENVIKVISKEGKDVTMNFIEGARIAYNIIEKNNIKYAILKSNSPSCGVGKIYDGSFTGKIVDGDGVTSKLFKEKGIVLFTENDDINI